LWIVLGLMIAAAVTGVVSRCRRVRRRGDEKETKNIYPLW
jgi:hypothetical protein